MIQDNPVASAFDAITRVAREAKIPLFSLDTTTVERGAIASFAQNQYQAGVDWATDVAVPVLLGRDPGTIVPVPYRAFTLLERPTAFDLVINQATASRLGLQLPPAFLHRADEVIDCGDARFSPRRAC